MDTNTTLPSAPGPGPPPPIPLALLPSATEKKKKTRLAYRAGSWTKIRPASAGHVSLPRSYPVPMPPQYAVGFRYQPVRPESHIVEVSESEDDEDEGSSSSSEEDED